MISSLHCLNLHFQQPTLALPVPEDVEHPENMAGDEQAMSSVEEASEEHGARPFSSADEKNKSKRSKSTVSFTDEESKVQTLSDTQNSKEEQSKIIWWIKDLNLDQEDFEILLSEDSWLNDKHMYAANKILLFQFPDIGGFHSTLFVPSIIQGKWNYKLPFPRTFSPAVQILNNSSGHWITSINYDGNIYILDSLGVEITTSVKMQLEALYTDKGEEVRYTVLNVQKQTKGNCGVCAIANTVEFCINKKPSTTPVKFKSRLMRQHLIECFEKQHFTAFPPEENEAEVFERNQNLQDLKCNQCAYATGSATYLKIHKEHVHNEIKLDL